MIVLQAAHINKSFGGVQILADATLAVKQGERVGLVGRNGAGKSTLLKIITGQIQPDSGDVTQPKTTTIGYLAQGGGLESGRVVMEEMLSVFDHLRKTEQNLRFLEAEMGRPEISSVPDRLDKIQEEYIRLRENFSRGGGYEYEAVTRSVLHGLKFTSQYYNAPVDRLSGGEKTRLALAKLLLAKPDLLILDEPTNYLDMETLGWLEKYLQSYPGAILAVSHDRFFLDALAEVIYELENTQLNRYAGNYSRYLVTKAEEMERQAARYYRQQEEITRMQDFVQRNIARASTTNRAKSRQKALEKIKPLEKPAGEDKKMAMTLDVSRASGSEVLVVKDLDIGYRGHVLARDINFNIQRGERVALLGPNGTGKTTMLKNIAGLQPALAGKTKVGHHVKIQYYDQEQRNLSPVKNVLQELWDDFPHLEERVVRTLLGRFLFSGPEVEKKVGDLSGGEKSRLALAKLLCSRGNFLLLDEPTSHLDIPGREALEDALLDYTGTLLFVSHDRYFINKMATRIIELTEGGVKEFQGDFDYYLARKAAGEEYEKQNYSTREDTPMAAGKLEFLQRKEIQRDERRKQRRMDELENLIEQAEKKIALLEKELYLPEVYENHETYRDKNKQLAELQDELESQMAEWVELTD